MKEVAPLPRKDATWRWANNRNRELALGLNRPAVAQVADTFPGACGTVTDASLWSVWSTISLDAGRAPLPRLLPDLEGRLVRFLPHAGRIGCSRIYPDATWGYRSIFGWGNYPTAYSPPRRSSVDSCERRGGRHIPTEMTRWSNYL